MQSWRTATTTCSSQPPPTGGPSTSTGTPSRGSAGSAGTGRLSETSILPAEVACCGVQTLFFKDNHIPLF